MATKKSRREFSFVPRIINPVKIRQAVIFSGDSEIRESLPILTEFLPWIKTEILGNPQSVSNYLSNEATVFLLDDTALSLVDTEKIHQNNEKAVVVLLSSNPFIHRSPPQAAREKYPYTAKSDLVFAVNKTELVPPLIITSVVRAAEDLINIKKSSQIRRFIFLIVDDEPRWFSQFLPVLYNILGQRADVMLTRTYEETLNFLFGVEKESEIDPLNYRSRGHGDDVVSLITDVFFPKGSDLGCDAGVDLIRLVGQYYPRIPLIVASKAKEAENLKNQAFILPKGDPGSLQKLKGYILNFTGLGDFLIIDQEGQELYRIKDIQGMYRMLLDAEKETPRAQHLRRILELYGQNDKFSTWLYMHSYRELGDLLRPKKSRGKQLVRVLKSHLKTEMMRMGRTALAIDATKVFTLEDLLGVLQALPLDKIQPYSDNDILSSWLDRKGYPELAEELRPIHGTGSLLSEALAQVVRKWIKRYRQRDELL
jgi:hypothetical protein